MAVDKTFLSNLAVSKTKAGIKDTGVEYFTSIAAGVFADFTTGTNDTMKRVALYYETCIKRALTEIQPESAKRFADLGNQITINKEYADYGYLFELPTDFLWLIRQTDEASRKTRVNADIKDFTSYAHTVMGTDDNVYYCSTAHTSATADKPITGANYATYWTVDSSEEYEGAEWEAGKAYKSAQSGKLLLTDYLTNADGDSAYIEYIPYAQAGINDDPSKYSEFFLHAAATLLASEIELDFERRQKLMAEYLSYAKPKALTSEARPKYTAPYPKVINARTNLKVGR